MYRTKTGRIISSLSELTLDERRDAFTGEAHNDQVILEYLAIDREIVYLHIGLRECVEMNPMNPVYYMAVSQEEAVVEGVIQITYTWEPVMSLDAARAFLKVIVQSKSMERKYAFVDKAVVAALGNAGTLLPGHIQYFTDLNAAVVMMEGAIDVSPYETLVVWHQTEEWNNHFPVEPVS